MCLVYDYFAAEDVEGFKGAFHVQGEEGWDGEGLEVGC